MTTESAKAVTPLEAWSDDTALRGPNAPKNNGQIDHLICYLLTVRKRFGNTAVTTDLQWGAAALHKRDEQKERIAELEAALAALRVDAERYHVLRNIAPWVSGLCVIDTTEVPDDTTMWTTEGLDKRCVAALDMAAQERTG